MKLSTILVLFFSILFLPKTSSAVTIEDWNSILKKTVETGKVQEIMGGEQVRYLENISPNTPDQPRKEQFFSLRGRVSTSGIFQLIESTGVIENWAINENNEWEIEQWLFYSEIQSGKLFRAFHRKVIKKRTGEFVKTIDLPLPPMETLALTWDELLNIFK